MNFAAYSTAVARTMRADMTERESLANWALGLAGEVGEVCEPIKKHLFHGKPLQREALIAELGDVLWYLEALAQTLGTTLGDVADVNVSKLDARWPNGFRVPKHEEGDGA